MTEERIHRGQSAANGGVVNGVVVHERGEMHELEDGGERDDALVRRFGGLTCKERQRGTEHLAAHLEEVTAHLLDHREIGRDDPPHLVHDVVETFAHGRLDVAQRDRARRAGGSYRTAHDAAPSTAARRSATSPNSMSTTNKR